MNAKVPYYIANYIYYCKENKLTILGAFDPIGDFGEALLPTYKGDVQKCLRWIKRNSNKFANAWVNGFYAIEPNKYIIKINSVNNSTSVLKYNLKDKEWYFGSDVSVENPNILGEHTKEGLIRAGFDWVFFCDGVTIEEVYGDL